MISPQVHIIAGPNGVGKTTFAREFLPDYADCKNFVNADLIAQGVSPFLPEAAAFRAGRLMLREIEFYMRRGEDFGFETTLSGLSHLGLINRLKKQSYLVRFFFLWVPTVELVLTRVRGRVSEGGHGVDESIVRRRFERSIRNFLVRYRGSADSWTLFDNSGGSPAVIAFKKQHELCIMNRKLYNDIVASYERR